MAEERVFMIFKKNKNNIRHRVPAKKEGFNEPQYFHSDPKIFRVAFVIDGKIEEIVSTEERFQALLLSNPKIIDITNMEKEPKLGWEYDELNDIFIEPTIEKEENV